MVGEYIIKGKIFAEDYCVLIEQMLTGNRVILTQVLLPA